MSTAARARTSLLGTSPAEALTAFEEQDRREERGDDSHVDVEKMQQELAEKTQEFTNSLHQGREKAAELIETAGVLDLKSETAEALGPAAGTMDEGLSLAGAPAFTKIQGVMDKTTAKVADMVREVLMLDEEPEDEQDRETVARIKTHLPELIEPHLSEMIKISLPIMEEKVKQRVDRHLTDVTTKNMVNTLVDASNSIADELDSLEKLKEECDALQVELQMNSATEPEARTAQAEANARLKAKKEDEQIIAECEALNKQISSYLEVEKNLNEKIDTLTERQMEIEAAKDSDETTMDEVGDQYGKIQDPNSKRAVRPMKTVNLTKLAESTDNEITLKRKLQDRNYENLQKACVEALGRNHVPGKKTKSLTSDEFKAAQKFGLDGPPNPKAAKKLMSLLIDIAEEHPVALAPLIPTLS